MTRAACVTLLAALMLVPQAAAQGDARPERGRDLYDRDCAQCHGPGGQGISPGRILGAGARPAFGPPLVGAGARAAHLYLTTGYMPLADPDEQPLRSKPGYTDDELDALIAFVASLGQGPGIPEVDISRGNVAAGLEAYTEYCAGCHQVVAEGGVVLGGVAPALKKSTPVQIAEAVREGPYLMPRFPESVIDDATLTSIARYVVDARDPDDEGGWGIGHLGPIPEGFVAWIVAGIVLVGVARLLGERAP